MKLSNEFSPIVIVGIWNKGIFNPDWVGKYLLPNQNLTIEFPLNQDGSPRISNKDMRIFVLGNKLNFTSLMPTDQNLDLIEKLSLKIADYLPHTPVTAFGVNFLFETPKSSDIVDILHLKDSEKIQGIGGLVVSDVIRHSFILKNGLINLSIIIEKEQVKLDFNFHFDIKNLVDFKEILSNNSILELKENAASILTSIYGIE